MSVDRPTVGTHAAQRRTLAWIALLAWVVAAGIGVWRAAQAATEPPSMDTLSYARKAKAFWAAAEQGVWANPFNLAPSVRPPGTILMSYPLGFSADFRGYYFRSTFLPVLLLAAAVCVACPAGRAGDFQPWTVLALALGLAGTPMLFQFQLTDQSAAASFWGLTDGFLTGMAAFAMGAAVRGVAVRSLAWAVAAAGAGALSLLIKPAGLLVMALVGLGCLLLVGDACGWRSAALASDRALRRLVRLTTIIAGTVYVLTLAVSFGSDYFSVTNIAFGNAVLAVMKADFRTLGEIDARSVVVALKMSVGYVMPGVIVTGLAVTAVSRARIGHAAAAVGCLTAGLWFWLAKSGLDVVRYFPPFSAMAFVLLTPAVVAWMDRLPRVGRGVLAAAIAAPALVTVLLLFVPEPPKGLQRALKINLDRDAYRAESAQATAFMEALRSEGGGAPTRLFVFDVTPTLHNFYAVVEYTLFIEATAPAVSISMPRDWQRVSMHRLDEISEVDYIAFNAVTDDNERAEIFRRDAPNFAAENRLVSAWFSTFGEADGVTTVSETRVRLLKVVDRPKFKSALNRLRDMKGFSASFRAANRRQPGTLAELVDLRSAAPAGAVAFHRAGTEDVVAVVRAVSIEGADGDLHARFWLDPQSPTAEGARWVLFVHLVDDAGTILANNQVVLSGAAPANQELRLCVFDFMNPPPKATRIAYGFFRDGSSPLDFLRTEPALGDWDGVRVIIQRPQHR